MPAQSGGCAAGGVYRAGGGAGAAGGAVGGLFQGWRHGRGRPAGVVAEPVPAGGGDRADRSAGGVRLCGLPALSAVLYRAGRAGGAGGGYRHRQPCAGDGQCRARAARCAKPDRVRRGAPPVRRGGFDLFGAARRAGGDRDAALAGRAGGEVARASAGAGGTVDGRVFLRRRGGDGARFGGRGGAGAAVGRVVAAIERPCGVWAGGGTARRGAGDGLRAGEGAGCGLWAGNRAGRARWRAGCGGGGGARGAGGAGAAAGGADAAARGSARGCARLARRVGTGTGRGGDHGAGVAARDDRGVGAVAGADRRGGGSRFRRLAGDRAGRGARI